MMKVSVGAGGGSVRTALKPPRPYTTALHHGPTPGPYARALRQGPTPRPYTSATECSSAPNWKQLVTWTVLLHKYNFPFLLSQELQQHKHIV